MSVLWCLQSSECEWWDIFWICWFVFHTRQYKWNCFQFVSSRIGSCVYYSFPQLYTSDSSNTQQFLTCCAPWFLCVPTTLYKLKGKPHRGAQQTITAEFQTCFQRLVRSMSWSLLCCCVTVDHFLYKDGEGRILLPAVGVRRVTEESWLRDQGQAVAAQLWKPCGGLAAKSREWELQSRQSFWQGLFCGILQTVVHKQPCLFPSFWYFFCFVLCSPPPHPLPLLIGNSVQHHSAIIVPLLIDVDLIAAVVYVLIF